jgi:rifampicin phosphotransferase
MGFALKFVVREGGLAELGGKALALSRLDQAGLPIPEWFAVSPAAFAASLTAEQAAAMASGDAVRLQAALQSLRPCDAALAEICAALGELGGASWRYAVRSSAADEDSAQHSFAGQLETFLFVSPDAVGAKVAEVWRSGFTDRIFEYRRQHGLAVVPSSAPAVLVQKMVDADVSGVAFSADPVSGRRSVAVVSAVPGLGTALVGGEAAADVFKIDLAERIAERAIVAKKIAHKFDPRAVEGVSAVALSEADAMRPALTDQQAVEVARLARRAAHAFGQPQDIEWAIEGGQLYLLQSRAITTLRDLADPEGALNLWDNSNITESYNGVTTPLTFTFARYVYEGVYRQFCRILHVPAAKIAANDRTFSCMLGLIRGRIYYNLLNWYRVLALLPGFTLNRRFMEQMMGVRESLPEEVVRELGDAGTGARIADGVRTVRMAIGLIVSYARLDRQIDEFYARLNDALKTPVPPFDEMRYDELVGHYRKLERGLLSRWDAPLVNDFFAMIFHGAFRKLCSRWCGDEMGGLANDAIRGKGDIVSLEPATRMQEMARVAATHPELAEALREAPLTYALRAVRQQSDFAALFDAYLAKFGDRCMEELKLESETLHDNPLVLLRNVGELARAASLARVRPVVANDTRTSAQAEQTMRAALSGSPVRRMFLFWTMRQARKRVRNRENLRFERTRLFGTVRRIFLEIGRRLQSIGQLDDARDVFYLELGEILAFNDGTATTTAFRPLVAARKQEFSEYKNSPAPPDRFQTRGSPYHAQTYRSTKPIEPLGGNAEERRGLGCCPGVVRGIVRVVRDPKSALLTAGCILVADHTDPGWIMLFPSASGLLVERGSLLSHSAIVARELGIPAVISIPGLLDWLHDGDEVELDGATGSVRRLASKEVHA